MAPSRSCYLALSLLLCSVDFMPSSASRIPRKRSIQSILSSSSWPIQYWQTTPSTSFLDSPLLVGASRLGSFGWSPLLPRLTTPAGAPPRSVAPVPEPSPTAYLPALMAALRSMTPALRSVTSDDVHVGPTPTVCVHTHPAVVAPGGGRTLADLLTPSRDSQTETLNRLLNSLVPATSVLASRVPAASGSRRPAEMPDLSFLDRVGQGLLNPALFRTDLEEFPRPSLSGRDLREMAEAERNAATGRTTLGNGNPESELFPRSVQSSSESTDGDESERINRLLSANGGHWANSIEKRRRRRSVSQPSQSEAQHKISVALNSIIRRIGFEKYSEALQVIIQDLKPFKKAMDDAQRDIGKIQRTYRKFENDLKHLLEQTREAQQILLFILSSLFQENIVMRGKLEECSASRHILTASIRHPDRNSELNTLRQQLESKIRHYDMLVIGLLRKKSELEVERQRLLKRCNVPIDPGTQTDPFTLSTLLSLMTGIGEPSSAQRDINILLMRLFPDLYPDPPPPPPQPTQTARYSHAEAGGSGGGSGWLQVLIPLMDTRQSTEPLRYPFVAPSPFSYTNQYLLHRSSPLRHSAVSTAAPQPTESGDQFIMSMLQLMLQLYGTQTSRADESRLKQELVNFGRALLC